MKPFCHAVLAFGALAAASGAAALPHARGSCAGGSYRVVRGDTLYSIARLCRGSVAAIASANGLRSPTRIAPGQRLLIRPAAAEAPKPPEPASEDGGGSEYRFQRGDTLYSLARWSRVGLAALLAANPGIDPEEIEIGDEVRLPQGAVPPEPARARERGTPRAAPPPQPDDEEDEADKPDEEREREPEGM